jgi:hypothetical protein
MAFQKVKKELKNTLNFSFSLKNEVFIMPVFRIFLYLNFNYHTKNE